MAPFIPGGLLTLDLASTVGWCYGSVTDNMPRFGTWFLPRIGGEGARYVAFENELAATLRACQPSDLILEAALPLQAQTDIRSCRQQLTLRGLSYAEAYRASVAISEIDALSVRFDVLGSARYRKGEVKKEVVRHCRALGMNVTDHNAGDAVMLWLWARGKRLGRPGVAGPLFRETVY